MRLITLLILTGVLATASAADKAPDAGALPPGMTPEMMEKMQPGPEHARLMKLAGTYDVACTMWMDPAAAPMQSKGKAVFTPILGGYHLRQEYTGDMMGQTFTGVGTDSFDRVQGKYVATWVDSMNTGSMLLTGTSSDGGKTIEFRGECSCPMEGGMMPTRSVVTHSDDTHFTMTMFNTRKGQKEQKAMELVYSKTK